MSIVRLLRLWYNFARVKFSTLNLFDTRSTDPVITHRQILTTRLFLVLFLVSIFVLTVYTTLTVRIKNEKKSEPVQIMYENLQKQYPDTLSCPCAKISIPYGTFVGIVPLFHQVCYSDFVSQLWIDFAFGANATFIWGIDVRTSLSAMWQLIAALCRNAMATFNDTRNEFTNSSLISPLILPEKELRIKVQVTLDEIRRTALDSVVRPLTAAHRISLSNAYLTGLLTNSVQRSDQGEWDLLRQASSKSNIYLLQNSTTLCACYIDESCPMVGGLYLYNVWEVNGIYDMSKIIANETLPGFVVDCFPLQMTYASSLACFYNQSCLNILLSVYPKKINISILNKYSPSRFMPTTDIKQLIDELFIEQIFNETNYTSYYLQCAPIHCSYTFSRRFDWIYVITMLIAFFGGFNLILRLVTPYMIDLMLFLKRYRLRQNEPQQNENVTVRIRLRNLLDKGKVYIKELNLFDKYSRDPFKIQRGRISTRLYVILMTGIISVLTVYTLLSSRKVTETIPFPLQNQYEKLQQQYPDTLHCPCTVLSIPYDEIIQVSPTYHQLCTSNFVQPRWYRSLLPLSSTPMEAINFRATASSHFQILATFCEIANLTVIDATRRFNSTAFVNTQVLSRGLYTSKTNALINNFLNSTRIEFFYIMSLINTILHANQYITGNLRNTAIMILYSVHVSTQGIYIPEDNGNVCYCALNITCDFKKHRRNASEWTVEGVFISCSITDSVLKSSLICWYNISCLDEVKQVFSSSGSDIPKNITVLDDTISSRFPPSTLVEIIYNEMMVEEWNTFASYTSFYQKCRPEYCTFTYDKRHDVIYMIITIIGIFGGLDIILRLISSTVIKIFYRRINVVNPDNSSVADNNQTLEDSNPQSHTNRISHWTRFKSKLVRFNLFDSESDQIHIVRHERYSTRIYLLILSISILFIILYMVTSKYIVSDKILTPSQAKYEELLISSYNKLQCPCDNISLTHDLFVKINTTFHQVCSSDFVKEPWIKYLFSHGTWSAQPRDDIYVRGAAYFNLLSMLCILSQTTVNNAIDQFLKEVFISPQIIPEAEFLLQMDVKTHQFKTMTPARFSRTLQLLRDITHGNTSISSYLLNWGWWVKYDDVFGTLPTYPIILNNGCSCGTRSDCVEPGGVYEALSGIQKFTMPGLYVGCSVVETLLRSTLECLYNQTCIDLLQFYVTTFSVLPPNPVNVIAMNVTLSSIFHPNTTINDIVNALLVEHWIINVSYSAYYNQCAPIYCSYTIEERSSSLFIVSQILGVYGGLTVTLKFIIPYVVRLLFKIKDRCCPSVITPVA